MMLGWQALAGRLLAYALVALALYAFGRFHQMQIAERERDAAIIASMREGERHATAYFKKSAALVDAERVAARLRSLCGRVRSPGPADGAARADPGDRQPDDADRLAGELRACQRNRYKLEAIQSVIAPQIAR